LKYCWSCKQTKNTSLFGPNKNKKDGLSVGEKLYSIQRNLKNGLVYCSEKEYYEAMVLYLSFPVDEEDLPMTDEEFETWRNSK